MVAITSPVRQLDERTFEVDSRDRHRAGTVYRVYLADDGSLVCSCPAPEFHLHCWHLDAVRKELRMSESTALVPIQVAPPLAVLPTRDELGIIGVIAATVVKAKGHAVPASIDSAEKAAAVMYAGWELGAKPMTALRHISVINGRTEPDGQLMMGICMAKEPGLLFVVTHEDEEQTTMQLTRPRRNLRVEFTYTNADAKTAGLLEKPGPWTQHRKLMRAYACAKRLCRIYCPDLINQIASVEVDAVASLLPDEPIDTRIIDIKAIPVTNLYNAGDDDEHGEAEPDNGVVEATASEIAPPAASSPPSDFVAQQKAIVATHKDLVESFGGAWVVEHVMPGLEEKAPQAVTSGVFYGLRVKPEQAADVLAFLREKQGGPRRDE